MKKQSFMEGTFLAVLAIVISKLIGIFYVAPFYSIIGEKGSILYSYGYNIYLIFLSISSAGLPNSICKIISEYDALKQPKNKQKALNISLLIILSLSIICFLILWFFPGQISHLIRGNIDGSCTTEEIALVIRTVAFSVFLIPFLGVLRGFLQGHKIIKPISFSQVLEQIIRICFVLGGSYYAIKILNRSISVGVSIAIFGAFAGGLIAFLYILTKLLRNKKNLNLEYSKKDKAESTKTILKKILKYSIPFIIINVTVNIYNTIDMSLIIRTLSKIGYTGTEAEYVAGVVTTWGFKLNSIVSAIATGLIVSLIPNIVYANSKNNKKEVSRLMNKALQIILIVSFPMAFGLSFLAYPVWNAFYGYNALGYIVFGFSIITSVFCNIYLVSIQAAQCLNYYKNVYLAVIAGFVTNALLDVPFMLLCNKVGLPAFYGAGIATICGYLLSIGIVLKNLKKESKIEFMPTLKCGSKIVLSTAVMIGMCYALKCFVPFMGTGRLISIKYIAIYALFGALVYFALTFKLGVVNEVFGEHPIKNIIASIKGRGKNDKDSNN